MEALKERERERERAKNNKKGWSGKYLYIPYFFFVSMFLLNLDKISWMGNKDREGHRSKEQTHEIIDNNFCLQLWNFLGSINTHNHR